VVFASPEHHHVYFPIVPSSIVEGIVAMKPLSKNSCFGEIRNNTVICFDRRKQRCAIDGFVRYTLKNWPGEISLHCGQLDDDLYQESRLKVLDVPFDSYSLRLLILGELAQGNLTRRIERQRREQIIQLLNIPIP